MKTKTRKTVARYALCTLLLLAVSMPCVEAITPSYQVSSTYKGSTYHQNLLQLPLTGNGAFDTLSVALSQYGYHEGSGTTDLDGSNRTSTGNYTEYGFAFGKVSGTYGYAWCAVFAGWCLAQAGEEESAAGLFSSCSLWVAALKEKGQYTARSSHIPKMGDLIFFRSAGVARASDHVGLVRYVKGGRVYTVEGNSSGQVSLRNYALTDTYIVGYGSPEYRQNASQINRLTHEDKTPGLYVVSYDFLNVRSAASSSARKKGTLKMGELVQITEVKNGWGKMRYNGADAYVSLEYADFVSPFRFEISYVSEGKTLLSQTLLTTQDAKVAAFTPQRERYVFIGWRDATGTEYQVAQALPATDVILTAVWKEIPPPLEEIPDDGIGENEEIVLPEQAPLAPTPEPPTESAPPSALEPYVPDRTLATRVAGGIVLLITVAWGGLWYLKRKKNM